jgi:hypothetical protein
MQQKSLKLHNIAVSFCNQTLMIAVKCGELLAKKMVGLDSHGFEFGGLYSLLQYVDLK